MSRTPEGEVIQAVEEYLKLTDLPIWRNNSGAVKKGNSFIRFGKTGTSDFIGFDERTGRIIAIECKRPNGGRLSDEQKDFLGRVACAGGIAITARSLDEVLAGLRAAGVTRR